MQFFYPGCLSESLDDETTAYTFKKKKKKCQHWQSLFENLHSPFSVNSVNLFLSHVCSSVFIGYMNIPDSKI